MPTPLLRWLPCLLAALLLSFSLAAADEQTAAAKLEALGAKLVRKDGVVKQLTLTDCSKLGDAEFRALGELTNLVSLTLYGGCKGLNDETLPHLAPLTQLETLGTDGAQLSDEGLKHFVALKNLRQLSFFHLSFRKEGFTGAGFVHLQPLAKLERLTVAGMSMGDEGFAAIAKLTQLRQLSTWHTYQTEAGNELMARLPLSKLKIGQRLPRGGAKPSLTNESLPVLAGMSTLEELQIGEARLTLEGLRTLAKAPKLKKLLLYETDFPESDLPALRAALPGVMVEYQPLTDEQRKRLEQYHKS